jgi:hypothetical protein
MSKVFSIQKIVLRNPLRYPLCYSAYSAVGVPCFFQSTASVVLLQPIEKPRSQAVQKAPNTRRPRVDGVLSTACSFTIEVSGSGY